MKTNAILQGDALQCLKELPNESIDCVMTSPPYWALRDYGTAKWEGGLIDCNHEIKNNIKIAQERLQPYLEQTKLPQIISNSLQNPTQEKP